MSNKLPPFKGLNIRIPITIPIKGKGINQGSGLTRRVLTPVGLPAGALRFRVCSFMIGSLEVTSKYIRSRAKTSEFGMGH